MSNLLNRIETIMNKRKFNGVKRNQHTVDLGGFRTSYEIVGEL